MFNTLRFSAGLLLATALAGISPNAKALGLGNASVDSYLNQPLEARIVLITRGEEDISSVIPSLASAEDFALIGANLADISVPLRFSVVQEGDESFILVRSVLAVKDPVLRLIVEVNWASGRMLREYTLFLDPPVFESAAPVPVTAPEVETRPASAPPASQQTHSETPAVQSAAISEPAVPRTPEEGEYGPVQSGETLWRIASNWAQGTGLNVNSVMLAIQRDNPQAFINDNVNLLKRGAILRLPDVAQVTEISAETARIEVAQQNQAANRAMDEVEAPVATAVETPLIDDASQTALLDSPAREVEQEAQLELVPPAEETNEDSTYGIEESDNQAGVSNTVESLREELARKEEELIVEQQQSQYLQERLEELEQQLKDSEAGNVADQDLSQLERRLQDERLAAESKAEAAKPAKVSTASSKDSDSWFNNILFWVIGLLIAATAVVGWLMSRRSKENVIISEINEDKAVAVREMKDEAEEILKVLEPESDQDSEVEEETPPLQKAAPRRNQEEAEFLDEDSADPEVRLDLARAYIAMGDREAARVILAEVIEHGTQQQQAEATTMLDEL